MTQQLQSPFYFPWHPDVCPHCKIQTAKNRPFCVRCGFDLRHQDAKKNKKKGICIYCKRPDTLSDEHIFGKWLAREFPKPGIASFHRLDRPETITDDVSRTIHTTVRKRNESSYHSTTKNVCRKCNSSWMSKIQNDARTVIKTLAAGAWPEGNRVNASMLSTWAVMVTINLQCHGNILVATRQQLDTFHRGKIPSGFQVSIGLLQDNNNAGASFFRPLHVPNSIPAVDGPNFGSTWFCIERLAIHVFNAPTDTALNFSLATTVPPTFQFPLQAIWKNDKSFNFHQVESIDAELLNDIQALFGPVDRRRANQWSEPPANLGTVQLL